MDGTPTARMAGDVIESIKSPSFDHGLPDPSSSLPAPQPFDWEMTPALETALSKAKTAAHELVASQELTFLRTSYGKKAITKQLGYSPDSYTQMIIQLAYHRHLAATTNAATLADGSKDVVRVGGTYEAATTRKFQHGRTEAIRCVSEESEAFVRAMDRFDAGKVAGEEVKEAFGKAVKEHGAYARAAGNGMGVDRHMFGSSGRTEPFDWI